MLPRGCEYQTRVGSTESHPTGFWLRLHRATKYSGRVRSSSRSSSFAPPYFESHQRVEDPRSSARERFFHSDLTDGAAGQSSWRLIRLKAFSSSFFPPLLGLFHLFAVLDSASSAVANFSVTIDSRG